ncbi:MAG: hypothetical protein ACR2O3_10855 [Rhizobiaceae bacterium]
MNRRLFLAGPILLASGLNAFADEASDEALRRLKAAYERQVTKADGDAGKLSKLQSIYSTAKAKISKVAGSDARKIAYQANKDMKAIVK